MDELKLLIRTRHPIIAVETEEEDRLVGQLARIGQDLRLPVYTWSVAEGLSRLFMPNQMYETVQPLQVLRHIASVSTAGIYLLRDFHPFLVDAQVVRQLREIAMKWQDVHVTVVLSGPAVDLPPELRPHAAKYRLRLPDEAAIAEVVADTFRSLNRNNQYRFRLTSSQMNELVRNLKGLTLEQVRRAVSRAVLDDGVLDARDLVHVMATKRERIESAGLLEYYEVGPELPALGGLGRLKAWLRRYRAGFGARAARLGLRPPRGVMLVGVQGCGKSLAAKTIAREWSMPLLRLDPSRLLDKYIGESEKNLRRSFETAEAVSPVVLWIDEIEKAFAWSGSSEADAGLGRRLFGLFLTWLQEKKQTVFVAATANDLSAVPPELLRKGRFDEIFFVDLPSPEERRRIFEIHLKLRRQDPASFDLNLLVMESEGFSGAEIEQAIVGALYGVLAENKPNLGTEDILTEIRGTVPLSRARREHIEELREYARDRFVPAN